MDLVNFSAPGIPIQTYQNSDLVCETLTANNMSVNNINLGGTIAADDGDFGSLNADNSTFDAISTNDIFNLTSSTNPVSVQYGIVTVKSTSNVNNAPYNFNVTTSNHNLIFNINALSITPDGNVLCVVLCSVATINSNIFFSIESTASGTGKLNIHLLGKANGSYSFSIKNNDLINSFLNNQAFIISVSIF